MKRHFTKESQQQNIIKIKYFSSELSRQLDLTFCTLQRMKIVELNELNRFQNFFQNLLKDGQGKTNPKIKLKHLLKV